MAEKTVKKRPNRNLGKDRVGQIRISKEGYPMELVGYDEATFVTIRFLDDFGAIVTGTWRNFDVGSIANPNHRGASSIGYIGVGEYSSSHNGVKDEAYNSWVSIMKRVKIGRLNQETDGTDCCEEWECFQPFAKWYYSQPNLQILKESGLDYSVCKHINNYRNFLYSPENCYIVPDSLVNYFIEKKRDSKDLPYGISYNKSKSNNYILRISDGNGDEIVQSEDNLGDAIDTIENLRHSRNIILAEKYKPYISESCYNILKEKRDSINKEYELLKFNNSKQEWIGKKRINTYGEEMELIEYNEINDITVRFLKYPYEKKTTLQSFINGTVFNPMKPTVKGVGYYGFDEPQGMEYEKEYCTWAGVVTRCYDENEREKKPTYRQSHMIDEWLNYKNCFEWITSQSNYKRLKESGIQWEIDKDISNKHNKLYSPLTCHLVPHYINKAFTRTDARRSEFGIGVSANRNSKGEIISYNAHVRHKNKLINLGDYKTKEEAQEAYCIGKDKCIKELAEENYAMGYITKECYNDMMKYKTEPTD